MRITNFILIIFLTYLSFYCEAKDKPSDDWLVKTYSHVNEIYIKKGMITTLQFSSLIDYFLIGNVDIADAIKVNNYTLALSTVLDNETTNLNVTTKKGNYVFVLKTLAYKDPKEANLHINIGYLSNVSLDKLHNKIKIEEQEAKYNPAFDYSFIMQAPKYCSYLKLCHYEKIAPRKVWTDGIRTYLDYNQPNNEDVSLPNVYEVLEGIDSKVEVSVKDNIIIVSTLAKILTLVRNGSYVCIEYIGNRYEVS